MAYRKINIDGVEYQYTVGKTHVKFRGGKAVPVAEIGQLTGPLDNLRVTPGAIREYILSGKVDALFRSLHSEETCKDR